jgi:ubiquinone/menaquinone biosynthesis C-methylase UbiE
MEIRSQNHYWDGVGSEKRFAHPLRIDWLASHFSARQTILDCGCGYGRLIDQLALSGYHNVVGADFSQGMLRRCRDLHTVLPLVQSEAETLPFKNSSFDAVLLFALLTCMPMENQQRAILAEAQRILRADGLIYISDFLLNSDPRNLMRYAEFAEQFGTYGIFQLPEGAILRHHSEERIRSLTAAFDCLEYEPFTAETMNGHSSAAFQYLGRLRPSSVRRS